MISNYRILIFVLFIATVGCSTCPSKEGLKTFKLGEGLSATPLDVDTFVVKDLKFYDSNVLIRRMPDNTVIIASSPIETIKTEVMLSWIKKIWRPKKVIAINTHFHADGTGGNAAYRSHGVEIWSSFKTHELYQKRAKTMRLSLADGIEDKRLSENVRNRKDLPAHQFFVAQKGLQWRFGGEELIVFYPGPAHSPDNLVVYFPKSKILFGGCMVRALSWGLGNTKDANLRAYPSSVSRLLSWKPRVVVPGHGATGDRKLLDHTLKLALDEAQSSRKGEIQ